LSFGLNTIKKENEMKKLIGISLSLCCNQISRGEVDFNDVDLVISGTHHDIHGATWGDFIEDYLGDPRQREVARRLVSTGKIIEPRRLGFSAPHLGRYDCNPWLPAGSTTYYKMPDFGESDEVLIADLLAAAR
jgi:hypothetical protein